MNPQELQKNIEDLTKKNEELVRKLEDITKNFEDLKKTFEQHTHSGNDGSNYIYSDSPQIKPRQPITIGNLTFMEETGSPRAEQFSVMRGFIIVGDDGTSKDGLDNAQITFEHQPSTDGDTNQSFFYGYRGRIYVGGSAEVEAGMSTMKQSEYKFEPDSLIGLSLQVENTDGSGDYEVYEIISNTVNTITIDGTWSFSSIKSYFFISIPIYLGAAQYPWRRVYTGEGTGGGVRFGVGATNEGQNGLLYMDTDGRLKFRRPSGTVDTV